MFLKEKAKDAISLYLCRYKNVQNFFVINKKDVSTSGISPERKFCDVGTAEEFYELCEKFSFTVPDADIEKRFSDGDRFVLAAEGNTYGCWGWYTARPRNFYVLEIDAYSDIPENAAVLYHYFTNPEQRRRGFYFDLLRYVAANDGKEYSIIYAYDTNPASKGAISKAGFKDMGEMSRKTFCGFSEIIRRYSE